MYEFVSIIINVFFKIGIVWKCWKMNKEKICLKKLFFVKNIKMKKFERLKIFY